MSITLGDYTGLAEDYGRHRPDYSRSVVEAAMGLLAKPREKIRAADIGAGTGIFTGMLADLGVGQICAIEPNDDMRRVGESQSYPIAIKWLPGNAEKTGLAENSCDWISMASSFHWADFDKAIAEFHRILSPGGRFVCLWNPRIIKDNPILEEIEAYLYRLKPGLNRVSSGKSGLTDGLTERLQMSKYLDDVVYFEGTHVIEMPPQRYVGVWKSVNDVRVQLGDQDFAKFLAFIEEKSEHSGTISCTYLTRAWSARNQ